MPRYDVHFPTPYVPPPTASGAESAPGESGSAGSFFSELLDIVNPLQHLPVISTIYRAATGDQVDDFARVAGDGLYCGMWGAIGAAADVAFKAITGRSAEDAVLAWFDSPDTGPVRVAANTVQPSVGTIQPAALPSLPGNMPDLPAPQDPSEVAVSTGALSASLSDKGITGEAAQRALYAYRRSMLLSGQRYERPLTSAIN